MRLIAYKNNNDKLLPNVNMRVESGGNTDGGCVWLELTSFASHSVRAGGTVIIATTEIDTNTKLYTHTLT